jgi:hypothetical protein
MHSGTFPALIGQPPQLIELIRDIPQTEVWQLDIGKTVQW